MMLPGPGPRGFNKRMIGPRQIHPQHAESGDGCRILDEALPDPDMSGCGEGHSRSDASDVFATELCDAVDPAVQDRVHRLGVEVPDDAVRATCSARRQPNMIGRPIATAVAPSANALTTSVPRRIPLSRISGTSPFTSSAMEGRTVIDAGVPSSARPPWFETCTAAAPAVMAARASCGRVMPLTTTGSPVSFRIISTSLQDRLVLNFGVRPVAKFP